MASGGLSGAGARARFHQPRATQGNPVRDLRFDEERGLGQRRHRSRHGNLRRAEHPELVEQDGPALLSENNLAADHGRRWKAGRQQRLTKQTLEVGAAAASEQDRTDHSRVPFPSGHEQVEQDRALHIRARSREHPALARARDPKGVSVLLLALYHRRPELAEVLSNPRTSGISSRTPPSNERTGSRGISSATRTRHARTRPTVSRRFTSPRSSGGTGRRPRSSRDGGDLRPLHSAAAAGSSPLVARLLAAGADPDARQQGGYTALHSAALHGREDLVGALLASGADPKIDNGEGRTAAGHARANGHDAVLPRLEAPR